MAKDTFYVPIHDNEFKVPSSATAGVSYTKGTSGGQTVAESYFTSNYGNEVADIAIVNTRGSGKKIFITRFGLADYDIIQAQAGLANNQILYRATGFTGGDIDNNFLKLDTNAPDLPSGVDMLTNVTSITGTTRLTSHSQAILFNTNKAFSTLISIRPSQTNGGKNYNNTSLIGHNGVNCQRLILNTNQCLAFKITKATTIRSYSKGNVSVTIKVDGHVYMGKIYIATTNVNDVEFVLSNTSASVVEVSQLDWVPIFGTDKHSHAYGTIPELWPIVVNHKGVYPESLDLSNMREGEHFSLDSSISLPSGIKVFKNSFPVEPYPNQDAFILFKRSRHGWNTPQYSSLPLVTYNTLTEGILLSPNNYRRDYNKTQLVLNPGEYFMLTELHPVNPGTCQAGGASDLEGCIQFYVEDYVEPTITTTIETGYAN